MAYSDRFGDADYRERDFDRERAYRRDDRDEDRSRRRGLFGQSWDAPDERRDGDFGRGRDFRRERAERAPEFGYFDRSSDHDRRSRSGRGRDRDEAHYGYDDDHEGLPIDETSRLIASNKVEGTAVYGREGERLGTIYNFMVDKYSGQVEYAVMRYGGFLGMGQRYYPLPWRILTYDTREGGYRIQMSDRDFERAPSFDRDDEPRFTRDYGRRVNNWYGLNY